MSAQDYDADSSFAEGRAEGIDFGFRKARLDHVRHALDFTDWELLSQQKLALLHAMNLNKHQIHLQGLLHWIDAMQDNAEKDGYPVVFLTDKED